MDLFEVFSDGWLWNWFDIFVNLGFSIFLFWCRKIEMILSLIRNFFKWNTTFSIGFGSLWSQKLRNCYSFWRVMVFHSYSKLFVVRFRRFSLSQILQTKFIFDNFVNLFISLIKVVHNISIVFLIAWFPLLSFALKIYWLYTFNKVDQF